MGFLRPSALGRRRRPAGEATAGRPAGGIPRRLRLIAAQGDLEGYGVEVIEEVNVLHRDVWRDVDA